MARPRKVVEEWLDLHEAVQVMSENSGHRVAPGYVRTLAIKGKITSKAKNKRVRLYLKSSLLSYRVEEKKRKAADR